MAGSSSQRKGKRAEREVARLLRDAGIPARRVPLSGSVEGFLGDVVIELGDRELVGEVKRRRDGFKELYRWLEGRDLLFCRADRRGWVVVMPVEIFIELVREVRCDELFDGGN